MTIEVLLDNEKYRRVIFEKLEEVLSKLLTYSHDVKIYSRGSKFYEVAGVFLALEYICRRIKCPYTLMRRPYSNKRFILVINAEEFRRKWRVKNEKTAFKIMYDAVNWAVFVIKAAVKNTDYRIGQLTITDLFHIPIIVEELSSSKT